MKPAKRFVLCSLGIPLLLSLHRHRTPTPHPRGPMTRTLPAIFATAAALVLTFSTPEAVPAQLKSPDTSNPSAPGIENADCEIYRTLASCITCAACLRFWTFRSLCQPICVVCADEAGDCWEEIRDGIDWPEDWCCVPGTPHCIYPPCDHLTPTGGEEIDSARQLKVKPWPFSMRARLR